jgi:phosphoglycolate phosphatase
MMNSSKKFTLVVFDWDGTLIDSEAQIVSAMQAAVNDVGLQTRTDDEIRNIIGLGLAEAISTLFPESCNEKYSQLVDRYRYHFLSESAEGSQLFPDVKSILEELTEMGYFLAVATGKGRRGLNKSLAETGLEAFFHSTRCADETLSKPNPQMLMEIMDELGVYPHETLMVGDTEYDLQMARNANTKSIAVSYGVHDKERLLACEPLGCLDDLKDIMHWLQVDKA